MQRPPWRHLRTCNWHPCNCNHISIIFTKNCRPTKRFKKSFNIWFAFHLHGNQYFKVSAWPAHVCKRSYIVTSLRMPRKLEKYGKSENLSFMAVDHNKVRTTSHSMACTNFFIYLFLKAFLRSILHWIKHMYVKRI